MISTSCVTGEGIELLQKMLFTLPKRRRHERKLARSFEYLVDDIFNVPGVGSVVSGFVNAGQLSVGPNSHVYVGPMDDGTFMKTVAKSAHIARINTTSVTSGQSACWRAQGSTARAGGSTARAGGVAGPAVGR